MATTRKRWTLLLTLVFFKHITNCLGFHSESLVRPLTITLVRAKWVGRGYDIASYDLDSFDDCIRKCGFILSVLHAHHVLIIPLVCSAVVLTALNHSLETGVTIRLVLTISGNPAYTHKNDHAAPTEGPVNDHPVYPTPLVYQPSDPSTPSASHRHSILRAATAAESAETKPRPSPQFASLPENEASISTGDAIGLASTVSHLDKMLDITNPRADVSERHSPLVFA